MTGLTSMAVKLSKEEIQYSSSVAKLLHHSHRLRHPLQPITLQLALTDRCNLDCDFCSVKNRAGDELRPEQILHILCHPVFRALRSVEITGGGEPTLYGETNEIIRDIAMARKLEMGLITNGVALTKNVDHDVLALFQWIRISLNSLDYLDSINLAGLPPGPTLGFSYVLNNRTTQAILDKVAQYAERYDAAYVRIVPDCLAPPDQICADLKLDHPNFYIQTKTMCPLTPVAPCRMGYLKPYLNADGFFYWCSGLCLEEQRFPIEYRMGAWDEITQIWGGPQRPLNCSFSKCFWVEHNKILQWINTPIKHGAFI